MSKEKKGQQEGEAPPHPGLEAFCEGEGAGHRVTRVERDTLPRPRSRGKDLPCPSPRSGPRVEGHAQLTHGEVHGVPLAQGPQAVQTATLVVILQELHKAWGVGGHQGWAGAPSPFPAPTPELSRDL